MGMEEAWAVMDVRSVLLSPFLRRMLRAPLCLPSLAASLAGPWPALDATASPSMLCLLSNWGSPGHGLPDPDPKCPGPLGSAGHRVLCSGCCRLPGPSHRSVRCSRALSPSVPVNLVTATTAQSHHTRCCCHLTN